ncbi:MAG: helix-turn-helix domain-containing protein [Porphyrobacter sp.]|nr:helix-turn-helix domain-containing protein [Porphyrobacter sp.]
MTFADDETVWRDAYNGEPPAKKVKRIRAATGLSVQDIADRIGLNRLGPDTGDNQWQQVREEPQPMWEDVVRRAREWAESVQREAERAREEAQRAREEIQRARQEAQRAREESLRRASEKMWQAAEREHAEYEARRDKVNGKAGRGHPKIDRERLFALHGAGLGVRAIARELGCSHVAVMKIIRTAGNQ